MPEYIERETLLDDIKAAKEHGGMGAVVAGTLIRYIKRQPVADVEPVRFSGARYRPNCGAKMEEDGKGGH